MIETKDVKNIVFISFGKDSLANLILMIKQGIKIDEVVYIDIRYTKEISGEHPTMAEWIPTAIQILKDKFDISVKILSAKYHFKEQFYRVKEKGNHIGDIYGFPYIIGAWCNSRLKMAVIEKYMTSLKSDVVRFVGIAYDEPIRYKRLLNKSTPRNNYRSLLYENKIVEKEAFEICKEYNLVSPFYESRYRGGCWFCVKQSMYQLYDLWLNYPTYFNELKLLEKDSHNTFKPNITLPELEHKFKNGYIPKVRKNSLTRKKEIDMEKIKLETIKQGQRFKYGEKEFVKLSELNGGYICLAADVWFYACFDKSGFNNWTTSSLRKELAARIGEFIPVENLIPFDRDLTTDDGMTDYETCTDIVSLLTCDEYRKYRKFIPNCGEWHWTITADSLEYSCYVRYVNSGGSLSDSNAYDWSYGVRSLCVLKSDTPVEVKEGK